MDAVSRLSSSELRDFIETRGIATHTISSRDELERLYCGLVIGTKTPKGNHPTNPPVDLESPVTNMPETNASGGGGEPNLRLGERNLDDERQKLEAELLQLKRIEELQLEIERLRVRVDPAPLIIPDEIHAPARNMWNEEAVERFSGDDQYTVEAFISDFEAAAVRGGWTEAHQFTFAKRFLIGTAKAYMRAIDAQEWNDLRRELLAEFGSRISTSAIHRLLANRRKQQGESAQKFCIAMREISRGRVDEADLVKYIVDGLTTNRNERLFFAGATSFNDLRILLARFQETVGTLTGPSPIGVVASRNPFTRGVSNTVPRLRCFNCQEEGHFASSCAKPRRMSGCFSCGQEGHIQAKCPSRRENQVGKIDWREESASSRETNNFNEEVSLFLSVENVFVVLKISALLDTGSPSCFIQAKFVPTALIMSSVKNENFVGLNGSPLCVLGSICCSINFRNKIFKNVIIYVVKDGTMNSVAILGRSFMCLNRLQLTETPLNLAISEVMNIDLSANSDLEYDVNPNISSNLKFALNELIKNSVVPHINNKPSDVQCEIKLSKEGHFSSTPRRLSYHEKDKVKTILDDLLNQNIIRPSNSPFSSPIVLVKKKSKDLRMCIDYRTLNKLTVRDNYPLPLIEDQLDLLYNKKYFSCLDLKNGFYHVRLSPESVPLTSFVTPHGQFEFLRMPFGLRNAPSVFQRFVNSIFRKLIDSNQILIYMDDIMIATHDIEEHLSILNEVFQLIREHGLQLKLSKCKFFLEQVDYLGYRVDSSGIQPNPENLEAVRGFPIPRSIKDVHSFLGLCSYFRKFIKNFAVIAKPLYDLLRKDTTFHFGEQENRVFEFLKKCLLDSPVLAIYSPHDETELHCDASSLGYGAILLQRKADNKFHPIFYFSKRTTDAESRYHSFELETLAIVNALKRFRVYLEGIAFKIITDCNSLTLTLGKKQLNPRIARWGLELENFNYKIEHRPNVRMRHVDSLSRIPEIAVIEQTSLDHVLAVEQGRDDIIVKLRQFLENNPADSSKFELTNGLVYRKKDDRRLFYVPSVMEQNVIRANHDEFGHFGIEKVHDLITRAYWFPHIRKKVKSHIRNCLKCVQFSPNSGKNEGELHSIPKGKLPFDTIHIDHLGPLSTTTNKFKHIFVIVDGFTKFVKMYPVRTTSSKETIKCLELYFKSYSRPIRIISDRGTSFTSEEFANFVDDHNITHIKIATASPQSNGQVERFNRLIIPLLAKISNEAEWHKKLNEAEFAINNSKNRSINNSPSMLLFGVNQRGPIVDSIRDSLLQLDQTERDLLTLRENAAISIDKSQESNKAAYDASHKTPHHYKENDLVMVSNYDCTPGVNKKLLPKYRGPYRVSVVLPNDRYILTDVENWQVTQRPYKGTHAPAQMRPWVQAE